MAQNRTTNTAMNSAAAIRSRNEAGDRAANENAVNGQIRRQ